MNIDKMKNEDIKVVAELVVKNMAPIAEDVGEKYYHISSYEELLKKHIAGDTMLVIRGNNCIEAFVWYARTEDKELEIYQIVARNRHKALGSMLIDRVLEDAKNKDIQRINTTIHFKNIAAQKFFERLMFTPRTIEYSIDITS